MFSLSNKEGCEKLAEIISKYRKIIATGGTANYLRNKGIDVVELSKITGLKEKREIKTLHPWIFEMIYSGVIDVVVVNLYPFSEKPCLNNIDIGGVTLLRAAAKNYEKVLVVCKIDQYSEVIKKFPFIEDLRLKFACEAFKLTSSYDKIICDWLCNLRR